MRGTRLVVVVVLGATLLTACSAPEPTDPTTEELPTVSIDAYSEVSAQLDYSLATVVLPLDQYVVSAPDYVATMLQAIAVTTDRCMVDKGYPAVADTVDWQASPRGEDRRYGIWSEELALQYGLDTAPHSSPPKVDVLDRGVAFNQQYATCTESATAGLAEQIDFSQRPNIDHRIRDAAQRAALAHPDGERAIEQWQRCMEDSGVVLDPATGYPAQEYRSQGKEAEIRATMIEAGCARLTGAVQTLYDLQARYEAAFIDSQAAALQEFAAQRADTLATLRSAIVAG